MVGIGVEDLLTPPAVRKPAPAQKLLRYRGFSSLIEVFAPGMDGEVVRHFLSMRVEAVVFIGHFHREEIEARSGELIARGTRHPVIDHFGLTNAHTVSLDRAAAMAGWSSICWGSGTAGWVCWGSRRRRRAAMTVPLGSMRGGGRRA